MRETHEIRNGVIEKVTFDDETKELTIIFKDKEVKVPRSSRCVFNAFSKGNLKGKCIREPR